MLIPFEGDLRPDEDYEGLRMAEAAFDEAAAGGCHFLGCSFVRTSFGGGRLRKSRFTDVSLREVRFVATDLAETGWQDTTLDGCALAGVQVDLRGATLGITAGWESLRGVTIDSVQLVTLAPYLARHLGITVAD